jgi:hypothetical protein
MRTSSKYGNRKTLYNGVEYDSRKEADYARDLDLLLHEKNGTLMSWERQIAIPLVVVNEKIANIVVDFRETYVDGRVLYVEIKSEGTKTDVWKLKWKLFEALYPEFEKRVVV